MSGVERVRKDENKRSSVYHSVLMTVNGVSGTTVEEVNTGNCEWLLR